MGLLQLKKITDYLENKHSWFFSLFSQRCLYEFEMNRFLDLADNAKQSSKDFAKYELYKPGI